MLRLTILLALLLKTFPAWALDYYSCNTELTDVKNRKFTTRQVFISSSKASVSLVLGPLMEHLIIVGINPNVVTLLHYTNFEQESLQRMLTPSGDTVDKTFDPGKDFSIDYEWKSGRIQFDCEARSRPD